MLNVTTPEMLEKLLAEEFSRVCDIEEVELYKAQGRVLADNVFATEDIPGFDRTTVDGYAVRASDTFGCTDSIPALLNLTGEIYMGQSPKRGVVSGECMSIPTGGMLPKGADSTVMVEYTEDYGDGTIGVLKPVAPGENLIFKGDDVLKNDLILKKGRWLKPHDIGTLAAIGVSKVRVFKKPLVGIISTGDELVEVSDVPKLGEIRDVNTSLISALVLANGCEAIAYGIVRDNEGALGEALDKALNECDIVVISGGSSVGVKDATCKVIENRGKLLIHGIAMKPGKPTILGNVSGKPIFGLPGHPAAAYFVAELFLRQAIALFMETKPERRTIKAFLTEAVSANHGRAQYTNVSIAEEGGEIRATPVRSKSGLITSLSKSDGYICIPRDVEGFSNGEMVEVFIFE